VLAPTAGERQTQESSRRLKTAGRWLTAGGEGLRLAYSLAEQSLKKDAVNRVMR